MAKYPIGSHPLLTKELIEEAFSILREGVFIQDAISLLGCGRRTFFRWLKEGADSNGDRLCIELRHAVKKARALANADDLRIIKNASINGQWQAAAWRLERRDYQQFGKRTPTAVVESVKAISATPTELVVRIESNIGKDAEYECNNKLNKLPQ